MKYLIIIEETSTGYSAYCPDIPGCVAGATTETETKTLMKEAIAFHLEDIIDAGEKLPEKHSYADYIEIAA